MRKKSESGSRTVAVTPMHLPREVLAACNILACEAWDPPASVHQHPVVQTYVCPLVRRLASFVLSGGLSPVDGLVFPHTCDSLQGMATTLQDFHPVDVPIHHYHQPRTFHSSAARQLMGVEVRRLWKWAGTLSGTRGDDGALHEAIDQQEALEERVRQVWRRRPELAVEDGALFQALRKLEYYTPPDAIAVLDEILAAPERTSSPGLPVLISGIVPSHPEVQAVLNRSGAMVVGDDYASSGRRIPLEPTTSGGDPVDRVVKRLSLLPPCSTRTLETRRRIDYLIRRARETSARGILFHESTFCEPEQFDLLHLKQELLKVGIPVLVLETEIGSELGGGAETRIEAFVEMLSSGGSR